MKYFETSQKENLTENLVFVFPTVLEIQGHEQFTQICVVMTFTRQAINTSVKR